MPSARAAGNSNGPSSTMAGMPSSTEPRMVKATIDTAMKPARPPGTAVTASTSDWLKPDCVSAQAMAVAIPIISKMAPASDAVPTSIGYTLAQLPRRYSSSPARMV